MPLESGASQPLFAHQAKEAFFLWNWRNRASFLLRAPQVRPKSPPGCDDVSRRRLPLPCLCCSRSPTTTPLPRTRRAHPARSSAKGLSLTDSPTQVCTTLHNLPLTEFPGTPIASWRSGAVFWGSRELIARKSPGPQQNCEGQRSVARTGCWKAVTGQAHLRPLRAPYGVLSSCRRERHRHGSRVLTRPISWCHARPPPRETQRTPCIHGSEPDTRTSS